MDTPRSLSGTAAVPRPHTASPGRLGFGVGAMLLSIGVASNYWTVAWLLTPDGTIDSGVVRGLIWLFSALFIATGVWVIKHPAHGPTVFLVLLPAVSLLACSFLVFGVCELFPSLIRYMPFAGTHYYAMKARYMDDPELVFRNRPSSAFEMRFRGDEYRDSYGEHVPPMAYRTVYDRDGFRQTSMADGGWDVIVLGDSYMEFGHDEYDTFTSRLEVISGLRVSNLATAAYGPFQYVSVLKRYGLAKRPQVALFSFFEGNDIADIRGYMTWQRDHGAYGTYNLGYKNVAQRYVLALTDVVGAPLVRAIDRVLRHAAPAAAEPVILTMRDATITTVFSYLNETRRPDELLELDEWRVMKRLLEEFKALCARNAIVPVVVFLPTKAHIYAEYSRPAGEVWSGMRDQQIASKDHVEAAMRTLCRTLGVRFVSVSEAFARAAREGRFLYYAFDSHWNSAGRELAASVVAEALAQSGVMHARRS
jgi:SGNH hydrolase-like domain, acetyltransferase AlgX